jgi:hypothetical protein
MSEDTRSNSYGRPMSVLVVDDKEPFRQVMRRRAPWTSAPEEAAVGSSLLSLESDHHVRLSCPGS